MAAFSRSNENLLHKRVRWRQSVHENSGGGSCTVVMHLLNAFLVTPNGKVAAAQKQKLQLIQSESFLLRPVLRTLSKKLRRVPGMCWLLACL